MRVFLFRATVFSITKILVSILLMTLLNACGGGSGLVPATVTETYTIGGSVVGLSGTVVLQNKAADDLEVSDDGVFTFSTPASTYSVSVLTQPSGQVCSVTNGSGIATEDVTDVAVNCVTISLDLFLGSMLLLNCSRIIPHSSFA